MAWSLDDTDSVIWLPKSAGSSDDDALDDDEQTSYAKQALQKEGRENMPCSDLQIEGLDAELLQKLQVIDGELAPMSDSGENAIAVAAETDDNGNLMRWGQPSETGRYCDRDLHR